MSMPFEVSYCTRFCCAIKSGRCSVCATPVSFVSSFLPVLNFTSNAHFVFPYLMGFSFLTSSMLRSDESYGDYASNSLQASSGTSATSASVLAVVCIPRFSLCSVSRLPIYTSLIKTVAYGGVIVMCISLFISLPLFTNLVKSLFSFSFLRLHRLWHKKERLIFVMN